MAEGNIQASVDLLAPLIGEKGVIGKEAREMLGNIRLKQVLSPDSPGMEIYTVKRGDSWLRIASKLKCPVDYLVHINQLMELGSLQEGDAIKYKTLDYRVEVDVKEKEISIWEGDSFIKSYPIVKMEDQGKENLKTSVKSKTATEGGNSVTIYSSNFSSADKSIELAAGGMVINPASEGRMRKPGFYLKREDCNELALLLRPANEVLIIRQK